MDVQERVRLHSEACIERDTWARKALALVDQGRMREARKAAHEAETWAARVEQLEPVRRGGLAS